MGQGEIVTQLHNILKPFLLRRLKTEVEQGLPPKKEYLLYAPLTQQQSDIYKAIVNHTIRDYLVAKKIGEGAADDEEEQKEPTPEAEVEQSGSRTSSRLSKRPRIDYSKDSDDTSFMEGVLNGDITQINMTAPRLEKTAKQLGQEWALKSASRFVVPTRGPLRS